jgi:hypothetical protein
VLGHVRKIDYLCKVINTTNGDRVMVKNMRRVELEAEADYLRRMLSTRQRDGMLIAELNEILRELADCPVMIVKPFKQPRVKKTAVTKNKVDKPPVFKTIKDVRNIRPMRNFKAVLTDAISGNEYKLLFSLTPGARKQRTWVQTT